jgi:hypothetical protein
MNDEEIKRLDVLVSEVDRPMQPPLPRYAIDIMLPGLTEQEGSTEFGPAPAAASTFIVQPVGWSTSTSTTGVCSARC